LIAAKIYNRYDAGGPAGDTWHPQRVAVAESSQAAYDLCRSELVQGGVYSSQDEVEVQSLARRVERARETRLERHLKGIKR
jgi:hypothetical protein